MRLLFLSLAVCLVGILLFGAALAIRARDIRHVDAVASSTHNALCTFKLDLQRRADDTEVFVIELEHGARPMIPGISISDLKRSLGAQRATLASLSELECP